ncbi:hypothetical protein EOM39_03100 [Candidatus Gracilibacteria bacterium]|nr:hypothetical protein [Candidatus Gracilibacteria bacterium]
MKNNFNLKIYGITTVGAKGQIIIPKEARDDFDIIIGNEYELAMIDKKTFGIGSTINYKILKFAKTLGLIEKQGFIKIGTKFQFVIPSNVRKEIYIKTGDNLLVIGKLDHKGLGFIKNDNIEYLFEYIKKNMN